MTITEELNQKLQQLRTQDTTIFHGCVIARDPDLPFGEMDLRSQIAVAYDAMSNQLKEAGYLFEHLTQMNIPDTNGAEKTFGVAFIPMVFVDVEQMDGVILTLHVYRGKLTNSIRFHYTNGQTINYGLTID